MRPDCEQIDGWRRRQAVWENRMVLIGVCIALLCSCSRVGFDMCYGSVVGAGKSVEDAA